MLPLRRSHADYLAHLEQYADLAPRAEHPDLRDQIRRLDLEPAAALLRPFLLCRLWRPRPPA